MRHPPPFQSFPKFFSRSRSSDVAFVPLFRCVFLGAARKCRTAKKEALFERKLCTHRKRCGIPSLPCRPEEERRASLEVPKFRSSEVPKLRSEPSGSARSRLTERGEIDEKGKHSAHRKHRSHHAAPEQRDKKCGSRQEAPGAAREQTRTGEHAHTRSPEATERRTSHAAETYTNIKYLTPGSHTLYSAGAGRPVPRPYTFRIILSSDMCTCHQMVDGLTLPPPDLIHCGTLGWDVPRWYG